MPTNYNSMTDNELDITPTEPGSETSLRRAAVTRYVLPLREGGSLPALAEADDGFSYVVKFRGAGHGTRALIAELIGTETARLAGLRVPETVFLDLDEDFGRTEGDEEIQDLLRASRGLNLGLHFLRGSLTWDVAANRTDAMTASMIVWLDAFLTNVDRSVLNTNMLWWNNELWMIDYGASLLFQHNIGSWEKAATSPFPYISKHALLRDAALLREVDASMRRVITPDKLRRIVSLIPDDWLDFDTAPEATDQERQARRNELRNIYAEYLVRRLASSEIFTEAAIAARDELLNPAKS